MRSLPALLIAAGLAGRAFTQEIPAGAMAALLAVGPEGKGNAEASAAWQAVAAADAASLPAILTAMNGAGELAANWLRGAISVIAQKHSARLPLDALEAFARDVANAPPSRIAAMELVRRADEKRWEGVTAAFLHDPAAPLRREPVQRLIAMGTAGKDTMLLRKALEAARDEDHVTAAADALRERGETVDLPRHFGFLMDWHVIGPFDNRGRKGFAEVYPPESGYDAAAEYQGKELKPGEKTVCRWIPFTSGSQFGMVDLNKPLGMNKEVAGYAFTKFISPAACDAELRLGSKNAWKVWCNGQLLFGRDEYHRGARIDQYKLPVKLKAGPNDILVKCCQNEQTETWTVEWEFQLRVCDAAGTAIVDPNRKPTPPEALKGKEKAAQ